MTIVACVSSIGFTVTPLFVLLCQQLNHSSIDHCSITIITETVDTKGLMNSNIFIKWLDHFSSNVLSHVGRPIALVYNGYGSQYNTDHVEKWIELRIILVLLPSNSTHLIQPLDISVFKPFKTESKHQMEKFMIEKYLHKFYEKISHWNCIYRVWEIYHQ